MLKELLPALSHRCQKPEDQDAQVPHRTAQRLQWPMHILLQTLNNHQETGSTHTTLQMLHEYLVRRTVYCLGNDKKNRLCMLSGGRILFSCVRVCDMHVILVCGVLRMHL